MKRFGEIRKRKVQDEYDTGDNKKVEGLIHKWCVLFEKNLNKIANSDRKTCKKEKMKSKLGKDSITSS